MFATELWGFIRSSTPARRRQRYGDIDYDWDHRVNTTSATVNWRDRLLGILHSAYQPTEPEMFREMLDSLDIDFPKFTFIDLGSGKGRTMLMAAEYPFRRIVGVELLPDLNRVAEDNIRIYKNESQRCFDISPVCADAREYEFPPEPILLYLFHPLSRTGLERVVTNLRSSLQAWARPVILIYYNPVLEDVLRNSGFLRKIGGTCQYAIYSN
jgi:SAM-dependent methyltransferase